VRAASAWLVLLWLAACVRYPADHRSYASSSAALAAFDRRTQEILATVTPRDAPLAAAAHVMVPTTDLYRAMAARGGFHSLAIYVATLDEHFVDSFVEALRRRSVFRTLVVTRRSESEDPPGSASDEYVMWFAWMHREQPGWWIRKGAVKRWVSLDMTQPDRGSAIETSLRRFETVLVALETSSASAPESGLRPQ